MLGAANASSLSPYTHQSNAMSRIAVNEEYVAKITGESSHPSRREDTGE